jgi:hypothetical protein
MNKFVSLVAVGAASALATVPAFAVGPDMTALTASVDVGTVTTAILAVAAIFSVLHLAIKGAKILIGMVKSS